MKFAKIFRILALAVIFSLLLVAIPASPALAYAYDIDLDPEEGEIGEYFYVQGDGWPPSTLSCRPELCVFSTVDIYFSSQEADTGDDIDDEITIYEKLKSGYRVGEDGKFKARVKVPSKLTDGDGDVHRGTYYVYVTRGGSKDIKAVVEFRVIATGIELDTGEGPVGTEVEITGVDFADREDITVKYDGEEADIVGGDEETDHHGEFQCSIIVPESIAGEHTITVSDVTGSEASATFTVEAEVAISPTTRAAGDEVTVTGTGFGGEKGVTITLNGEGVVTSPPSIETDGYGNFTASFEVPDVAGTTYDVEVEDDDGNKDEAEFTESIATEVSISLATSQASPGHVGMNITIGGVGFEADSQITITYATEPIVVATTISDAGGAFSATLKVPQSEPGEHLITASDGTNTLAVTFIMESEAPPTPALLLPELLPEEASRAEAETYFYWEGVTDDSLPVTYTLQVATDDDFTSAAIVLEKEGLTDSEYAIAEEEKLEPRKKEAPYYWRVKAIDSASNESKWSAPGSFYIGGFFWPSWIIHLWWGLGALGAGFLGFWLSKRTAYRY